MRKEKVVVASQKHYDSDKSENDENQQNCGQNSNREQINENSKKKDVKFMSILEFICRD